MEKENSASGGSGAGGNGIATSGGGSEATTTVTSASEKLADQTNPLLDPSALFGGTFSVIVSVFRK